MLQVGSVLDGKYKILNEIGHGGMSVVYLALNERANKTWAIKEVRKDGGNDQEVVSQGLIAETEMLKKLHHPNLPSIVDVIDTNDSFIIVMAEACRIFSIPAGRSQLTWSLTGRSSSVMCSATCTAASLLSFTEI